MADASDDRQPLGVSRVTRFKRGQNARVLASVKRPVVRDLSHVLARRGLIDSIKERTRRPRVDIKPVARARRRQRKLRALRSMVVAVGKVLPRPTSREAVLRIAYAIARFMESGRAYKTPQNPAGFVFTIKRVDTPNLGEQVHVHFRFKGHDHVYGGSDTLDVDAYVPASEWDKIQPALAPTPKPSHPKRDRSLDSFRSDSS